jgi:myo-inositol-1(or 4)-monophosphatase
MAGTDWSKVRKLAERLAREAGAIQVKKWGKKLDIRWKSPTNPVTEVDQACEALILNGIREAFPGHSVLGEETGSHGDRDAEVAWIVDPLDGTVNYSHGLPQFSVSIGVRHKGKAMLGVVNAPVMNEFYSAQAGRGATLNGRPIRVSRQSNPMEALMVSGFAYDARETGQNVPEWLAFMGGAQALRRLGCATLDYCWTACGRFEAFWEYGLNAWDSAAAELIVREAGGKVTDLAGRPFDIFKPGVLATNGLLHAHCLQTLKKARRVRVTWPPLKEKHVPR